MSAVANSNSAASSNGNDRSRMFRLFLSGSKLMRTLKLYAQFECSANLGVRQLVGLHAFYGTLHRNVVDAQRGKAIAV